MPHPAGKSPQGGLGTETKRNLKEHEEDAQNYVEWDVSRYIKRDVCSDVKEDVSNDVTDNIPNGGAEDVSFMSADLEACLLTPAPYLGQINLVSRSIPRLRFFKWVNQTAIVRLEGRTLLSVVLAGWIPTPQKGGIPRFPNSNVGPARTPLLDSIHPLPVL